MDIEGSEPDALAGCSRIIAVNSPVLSICVYHLQNHLWAVPLQMKALLGDSRFFLRSHVHESWDLVCYAIPSYRLQ